MQDLGGDGALAGARRSDQKDAARFFKIDRCGNQTLGQSKSKGCVHADFGKFGRLAHQGLAQTFGQPVIFHGRAQRRAQIGARKGDQIVA